MLIFSSCDFVARLATVVVPTTPAALWEEVTFPNLDGWQTLESVSNMAKSNRLGVMMGLVSVLALDCYNGSCVVSQTFQWMRTCMLVVQKLYTTFTLHYGLKLIERQ